MFEFEGTSLWAGVLASRDADPHHKARERLRVALLDIRNRVAALVSLISAEIPGLTVHDVTHLDALWETGLCYVWYGLGDLPTDFSLSTLLLLRRRRQQAAAGQVRRSVDKG
jgi:hypothetical protein